MRRDMDLVRLIVLQIEQDHISPNELVSYDDFETDLVIAGYTPDQVEYHLRLLVREGMFDVPSGAEGLYIFSGLTPAGHDFVDSVRDEVIWIKTKEGALKAGGFTVGLLGELAKGFIKKKIAELTDINL